MIYANHAHVFPKEIKEAGTVEKLLSFMDECSVDRAVAFAPFQDRFTEAGRNENVNEWLAKEIKNHDRLDGFGTIDFESGDFKGQVDRIHQLGLKGIKMGCKNHRNNYTEHQVDKYLAEGGKYRCSLFYDFTVFGNLGEYCANDTAAYYCDDHSNKQSVVFEESSFLDCGRHGGLLDTNNFLMTLYIISIAKSAQIML